MNKNSNGMTLIEILLGFLFIVAGSICSRHFGNQFGVWGYILGLIGGFLASFLIIGLVLGFIDYFIHGVPRYPSCKKGQCRKARDFTIKKINNDKFGAQCRCGDLYVRQGRRCLIINENGKESNYAIWIPFKGWKKDLL
jgi:hypothetical protein